MNPIDLIALEVLRVFEPAVFRRLPEVKEDLTDIHELKKRGSGEEEIRKTLEDLLEQSSESHRPYTQEILKQLFPTAEWVWGGLNYGAGFADEWYRELRICHPDVFDRYFHLTIPEGDISQAQLDRILSLAGNHAGLVTEFRALNEGGLLGVLLDRLEAYKQKIDIGNAVTFVTALFDIGDELPEDPGGFFTISPEMHANRIIYWYLKQEEDIGKRGEILKKAMNATMGLYLPIIIASLDGNEEERKKDPDAFTVTDTDLEELHRICLKRIEQAVGSGALASHPKMLYILYRWREWKSPDSSRQWVEKLIDSGDGVLSFLTACLHRSTSHGMGDHVSQEHWRIKMKTVEDFVSVDILEEKVAALSCENLSDDQKKAVKAFQKAIKRRQEGRSDDDWRNDDDE